MVLISVVYGLGWCAGFGGAVASGFVVGQFISERLSFRGALWVHLGFAVWRFG